MSLRRVLLFSASVVVLGAAPVLAQAQPACTTFDERGRQAVAFEGGDDIVVRGTGFGAGAVVFLRFEQASRSAELGRPRADASGAFRTAPVPLPADATDGSASIRALDARGSAVCAVTMTAVDDQETGLRPLYVVWGAALALFAVVLAILTYRRWKTERLREAMDKLAAEKLRPAAVTVGAPESWESDATGPPLVARPRASRPRSSTSWRSDDADDGWFDPEEDEDSVKEPRLRDEDWRADTQEPAYGRPAEDDDDLDEDEELQFELNEPPVLPEAWEARRLAANENAKGEASDAIERLRREVRAWGRP